MAPPLLWDGLLLPLHGHGLEVGPRSNFLGLRVLREEGVGAGRVPIWGHVPENLAAVVRIINMAADGRALAGDADLDGAPVSGFGIARRRVCAGELFPLEAVAG